MAGIDNTLNDTDIPAVTSEVLIKTEETTYSDAHVDSNEPLNLVAQKPHLPSVNVDTERCMDYAQVLYRCMLCRSLPAVFASKPAFQKHFVEVHDLSSSSIVPCHKCCLRFCSSLDYEAHQIERHASSNLEKRFGSVTCERSGDRVEIDPDDLPEMSESTTSVNCCPSAQETRSLPNKRKSSVPIAIRKQTEKPTDELDTFQDSIREKLRPEHANDITNSVCMKRETGHMEDEPDAKKQRSDESDEESPEKRAKEASTMETVEQSPVWTEEGKKVIVKEEPMGGMTDSPLALLKSLKMAPDTLLAEKEMLLNYSLSALTNSYHAYAAEQGLKPAPPQYRMKAACPRCGFLCVDSLEFTAHLHALHPGSSGDGMETYKLVVLKASLPAIVEVTRNMNVSVGRYDLLERLAEHLGSSDVVQWGSACNKAVKEMYPHSVAQRKGKYKFFFGIKYLGKAPKEKADVMEAAGQLEFELSPFRDLQQDTDILMKKMQEVICWTGHMDSCVTRDVLLELLSTVLQDGDVVNWGTQCNRAVRNLYPMVFIKRKGKFKSTCFFGVELTDAFKDKVVQPTFRKYSYYNDVECDTSQGVVSDHFVETTPAVHPQDGEASCAASSSHIGELLQDGGPKEPQEDLSSQETPVAADHAKDSVPTEDPHGDPSSSQRFVYQIDMDGSCPIPCSTGELEVSTTPPDPVHNASFDKSYGTDTNELLRKLKVKFTRKQIMKNAIGSAGRNGESREADSYLETLQKSVILHPGPFVMARIIQRQFSGQKVSSVGIIVEAMLGLQEKGLGTFYTMVHGKSKVFFKAVPEDIIIPSLTRMGVRLEDYKFLFGERDSKLNDIMHEKVKVQHPQHDRLKEFYKY